MKQAFGFWAIGSILGFVIGGASGWPWDLDDYRLIFAVVNGMVCGTVGGFLTIGIYLDRRNGDDRTRYDVWIAVGVQDPNRVGTAVAAILGLDPRRARARSLVDSGSPVRRKVRRAEVYDLDTRFAAWGLSLRIEPEFHWPPGRSPRVARKADCDEIA